MKSVCKVFLFLIIVFADATKESRAQNKDIDSLLILLSIDKPDTNQVNHLNQLSKEYRNIGEFENGLKYGNKALALAGSLSVENNRGWAKGMANAYNSIGNIYNYQGHYELALKNYFSSLKIRTKIGDKAGIAASYHNIGLIYDFQGNYNEALKNHLTSLRIMEEIGDKKGIANSYNNIGVIYDYKGNFPEAIKNYLAALKLFEEIKDKKGIADSYNNIGTIYGSQGAYSKALKNHFSALKIREEVGDKEGIAASYLNVGAVYYSQKNYPEALKNHLSSLKVYENINNKQGIATSRTALGSIYDSQGNYTEALKNHFAALKIKIDIGDKLGIADSYNHLGLIKTKLNKPKEAQDYLNKGLEVSKEIGYKESIKESYLGLEKLDSTQNNWRAAYQHHQLYIVYKDSIDNEVSRKKIIESTMNDDFDRKKAIAKATQDKKDALAEAEKKQAASVLFLVSCMLVLVFVFAGFIFRSLRITDKQKKLIEIQKNEVFIQKEVADSQRIIAEELREVSETQKHIVEEKQKEIVSSITYAKRIQTALLTSDEYIKKHLASEHFILFKPKDIVSGDFYWAQSIAPLPGWDKGTNKVKLQSDINQGNIFYLITADCTGHGVPGAFMSMLNISYLHENIVERNILLPHDILNLQRKEIIQALNPIGSTEECKDGMDCTLCVYDFDNMLLHFAAANNPLWLVRNKELTEYKADKMPVGKYNETIEPFNLQTIDLQKGDIIYTSTDGFADQFGGNGKKLMKKKFKEELLKIHHQPMSEQREHLNDFFENWKGSNEQVDDVCIIGVRI
ncbi:MAG: tetratricopeptide repeat protein [Bacteroidota bacterium]